MCLKSLSQPRSIWNGVRRGVERETVGLRKIETPRKIHYDFMDFNGSLYNEKLAFYAKQPNDKPIADELAQDYIDKMPITEYISEIKERLL